MTAGITQESKYDERSQFNKNMHKFTIHQLMSRNCMKILGTVSRRLDEHTVQALSAASWRGRFILQIGLLPNCSREYLKETHTAWGQSQSTPSAFVPL